MAEYDTWIRQEREYKNILDQIKISFVQAVLNRLEVANSTIIPEWEQCVASLTKEYETSKENSQHLSLIMEYLRVSLFLIQFRHSHGVFYLSIGDCQLLIFYENDATSTMCNLELLCCLLCFYTSDTL